MRIPFFSRLIDRKNLSKIGKPSKKSRSQAAVMHAVEGLENRCMMSATTFPTWKAAETFGLLSPTTSQVTRRVSPKNGAVGSTISGLYPAQVRTAYGMTLMDNGANKQYPKFTNTGLNQNIAIIGAGATTLQNDLNVFSTAFGLPITKVNRVLALYPTGSQDTAVFTETASNVEWAHAIAPNAKISLFEPQVNGGGYVGLAPNGVTEIAFLAAFNAAVNYLMSKGGGALVIPYALSQSDPTAPTLMAQVDQIMSQPGAANITFLCAAGDRGALDFVGNSGVSIPGSSQYAISVGGTDLSVDVQGNRIDEEGWRFGGGGYSSNPLPAYQQNVFILVAGVPVQLTSRSTPDVSVAATSATDGGYAIYYSGPGGAGWEIAEGTSISASVFAGMVADVNELRRTFNNRGLIGRNMVTDIYTLYKNYPGGNVYFDDLSGGGGVDFSVVPRVVKNPGQPLYDQVSGLGTPICNNLIPALGDFVQTGKITGTANFIPALANGFSGQGKVVFKLYGNMLSDAYHGSMNLSFTGNSITNPATGALATATFGDSPLILTRTLPNGTLNGYTTLAIVITTGGASNSYTMPLRFVVKMKHSKAGDTMTAKFYDIDLLGNQTKQGTTFTFTGSLAGR